MIKNTNGSNFSYLRNWLNTDLDFLAESFRDPLIAQSFTDLPSHCGQEEVSRFVSNTLRLIEKESAFHLAIVNGKEIPIGGVSVHNIIKGHKAEIGFWLDKDCRRNGIGQSAVRLLLNHYKSLFHLQKFVAYTLTDNFRAIALLEIIGFKRE
ncbi:MAG: hypothetical protein COU22_03560, partial [Candidatus Komeilibacteria bacterium CG10_big_fil_rev_8_21_14_0_10_41_13]